MQWNRILSFLNYSKTLRKFYFIKIHEKSYPQFHFPSRKFQQCNKAMLLLRNMTYSLVAPENTQHPTKWFSQIFHLEHIPCIIWMFLFVTLCIVFPTYEVVELRGSRLQWIRLALWSGIFVYVMHFVFSYM